MALIRTSEPAVTPLTLADAKAHLRVDANDEDALILSLIETATQLIEKHYGLALITQGWTYFRDSWPESWLIELPLSPLVSVTSILTWNAFEVSSVFDPSYYFLDTASSRPRLILHGSAPWPHPGKRANGIEIALTAGFGDTPDDVPNQLRHAILLLVAHWYETREPVVLNGEPFLVPPGVAGLLSPFKRVHL